MVVRVGVRLDEGVDVNLRLLSDGGRLGFYDWTKLESGRNGIIHKTWLGHIVDALN